MSESHCEHCPIAAGKRCPAEAARTLCRKVDPASPEYRPGWPGAIVEHARQQAQGIAQPSLPRRAISLTSALWHWACSGFAVTSEADRDYRRAICRGCPQFDGSHCRICGCQLSAKIAMRTEHCPEGRW